MTQSGGRQHVIPASHIGNFSDSVLPSRRESIVWFRRDSMPKPTSLKAENVGIHKHIYTLQTGTIDDRYVDKTWDYVEHNLKTAVQALEDHTKSPFFHAEIWATVLVPFVAQLFVRGVEYSKNLLTSAPFLEEVYPGDDIDALNDNTNLNRLIDFQINCGLLCGAEWKLLHNESSIPLILNDLGYVTFNGKKYGGGMGYLIPLSKSLILMIFKNPNPSYGVRFSGFSGSYKN